MSLKHMGVYQFKLDEYQSLKVGQTRISRTIRKDLFITRLCAVRGESDEMHFIYGGTRHVSSFAHLTSLSPVTQILTHADVDERLRHAALAPHFTCACVSLLKGRETRVLCWLTRLPRLPSGPGDACNWINQDQVSELRTSESWCVKSTSFSAPVNTASIFSHGGIPPDQCLVNLFSSRDVSAHTC